MHNTQANIGIAIFAKTPALSPVKTRLAADIGHTKATAFYQLSLACAKECALDVQQQREKTQIYWALAEEQAPNLHQWKIDQPYVQPLWTGEGDLGQRLFSIYDQLLKQHDIVILIGSDSPHLSSTTLIEAIHHLQHKPDDVVIGPCEDGGFYLFAARTPISQQSWTAVTYSQHDTRQQLMQQIHQTIHLLEQNFDIDTVIELEQLKNQLLIDRVTQNDTKAQKRLKHWITGS